MVEGMEVISARHVPDGKASKAMSLVAGADYLVQFREGKMPEIDLETKVPEFFALPQIEIMRKTKRSEKLTDIRPWIYDMKVKKSGVWMQLSTKCFEPETELVMEAFCKWCGLNFRRLHARFCARKFTQTLERKKSESWFRWKH